MLLNQGSKRFLTQGSKMVPQSRTLYIKSSPIKESLHFCESFSANERQLDYCHHKINCSSCLTTNQLKT